MRSCLRLLFEDTDAGPGSVLNVPGMLGLHELAEPYKPKATRPSSCALQPEKNRLCFRQGSRQVIPTTTLMTACPWIQRRPKALSRTHGARTLRLSRALSVKRLNCQDEVQNIYNLCPISCYSSQKQTNLSGWLRMDPLFKQVPDFFHRRFPASPRAGNQSS